MEIGRLLYDGIGTNKNNETFQMFYSRDAEQGDPSAKRVVGTEFK